MGADFDPPSPNFRLLDLFPAFSNATPSSKWPEHMLAPPPGSDWPSQSSGRAYQETHLGRGCDFALLMCLGTPVSCGIYVRKCKTLKDRSQQRNPMIFFLRPVNRFLRNPEPAVSPVAHPFLRMTSVFPLEKKPKVPEGRPLSMSLFAARLVLATWSQG